MAIETRDELIEALALVGITGLARAGDLDNLLGDGSTGGSASVDTLEGATDTGKAVMKSANPAAARTAIGAGTSSVVIGTGATQAKAGNYTPTLVEIESKVVVAPAVTGAPQDTDTLLIIRGGKIYTVTLKAISDYVKVPAV